MKRNHSRRKFLKTVGRGAIASSVVTFFPFTSTFAQTSKPRVALFWEPGFPSIEGLSLTRDDLQQAFAEFELTLFSAADLVQLKASKFDLLVMPYGQAFPKSSWSYLLNFLREGGNWLNLGGVPFASPVVKTGNEWRAQDRQTSYHKRLGITHSFPVNANEITSYKSEPLFFTADKVYEFHLKLTAGSRYPDESGSDGPRNAIVRALAIGLNNKYRPIAAPIIQLDQLEGPFGGGRWVLANFKGRIQTETVRRLAQHAAEGAVNFYVTSGYAVYRQDETPAFSVEVDFGKKDENRLARNVCDLEILDSANKSVAKVSAPLDVSGRGSVKFKTQLGPGLYRVNAQTSVYSIDRHSTYQIDCTTGFWIYDASLLSGGKSFTVDTHSFYRDGECYPVTGTTYMASDTHRQFLFEPNAFIFDNDFREMKAAGVNMVRTGIWTGWKKYMPELGVFSEATLRALEAFFLTARKHDIPVIFTFFAFLPETWGGRNAYLDPQAVNAQKQFISSFVERYSKVDDVIWDLINEPSFCSPKYLWSCRPNYDDFEQAAWRDWLKERYPAANDEERAAHLQDLWRAVDDPFDLPKLEDFDSVNISDARTPLKTLDYRLFAQDMFARWVRQMTEPIRRHGNLKQMITVGQDEGGLVDSPNNQFFSNAVGFTSLHNWWANDDLVWDNLLAKVSDKPCLVEETGIMFYEKNGGTAWRTESEASDLLERKMAISFAAGGAGFVEWIWNTNPYIDSTNEAAIGFHRTDGSAKPELEPFLDIAAFMKKHAPRFRDRESEQVLMVIPHSQMFAPRSFAVEATRKCVRAMYYNCRVPLRTASEYALDKLSIEAKLIIVPAARVLRESCWQALLSAASRGATVAITGVIDEDEHWKHVDRTTQLGWTSTIEPVLDSEVIRLGLRTFELRYEGEKIQRIEKAVANTQRRGSTARVLIARHGSGRVCWSPLPLELGDSMAAIKAFYQVALAQAHISPAFTVQPNTPSVLIIPAQFRDAILYTFVSESDVDTRLHLQHRAPPRRLSVKIPAGRTNMILLDRKTGELIDSMYPTN